MEKIYKERNNKKDLEKISIRDGINKIASPYQAQGSLFFVTRKEKFLWVLKGKRKKYKKYLDSPLRYAGGKSWAVGYILEYLPENIKRLISPFFGGGSIEIAVAKELGIPVIGYDIFDILVNYWHFQINHPYLLYRELTKLQPNKETYNFVKNELKNYWEKRKKLPLLELAACYYFNHNLSYGPGFLGWMSTVYANEKVYQKMIEKVRDFNVKNIKVECASFEKVIPKHKYDFLYCDPPYYLGKDSTVFRGLYPQRNFPIHHNNFNHQLLRELLLKYHKGGFILSYNDAPTIREWYKKCKIIELPVQYTMGQGEIRLGTNRKREKKKSY